MWRLPKALTAEERTRLLGEQQADGGWPTPYDPGWRPWTTASSLVILSALTPS